MTGGGHSTLGQNDRGVILPGGGAFYPPTPSAHATPTHPPTRGFYGHIRLQNSSCSEAGIVINHEGIVHYGTTSSDSGLFYEMH